MGEFTVERAALSRKHRIKRAKRGATRVLLLNVATALRLNMAEKAKFRYTSQAATHDHKGKWLDEETISFVFEGLQEGKPYTEELEVEIQKPNEIKIREKDTLDGQVISTMDVTLRK